MDDYCSNCCQELIDTSENPDSSLCTLCREEFIRHPIPKWIFLVIVAVMIITGTALVKTPAVLKDYKIYKTAESSYNQKYFNKAADDYLLISDRYKSALRINERMFLALMKAQRFEEAYLILDERLAGEEASDETYDEINSYASLLDRYGLTLEKLDPIFKNETINTDYVKTYKKIEPFLSDKECETSVVLFYLSQLNIGQNKLDAAIKQLEEALKAEPRYTFMASFLGNAQRRLKLYDAAIKSYESALALNLDDETAYRGLGVVYLVKGEKEKGLAFIKKAYDINKNGLFVADAYVVALHANGKIDESFAIYSEIKKDENYIIDKDMDEYLAGRKTLEQLYTN
ncbi:MAG: tetratricopeptide repeat protein [Saccharofermentanales bacterium]